MNTLQFYTSFIYNSIHVSHTRDCAKQSLSGFIRVTAHSTIRLCLPVLSLSKSLEVYWGHSSANKLQWGLVLTSYSFHCALCSSNIAKLYSFQVKSWVKEIFYILNISVCQMGKLSVMYIPGKENNKIVYTAAFHSFIYVLIFLFFSVNEDPLLIWSMT